MDLSQAIKKSIKHYYENGDDDSAMSKLGERKYTKKYLDELQQELVEPEQIENKQKINADNTTI